MAREDRHEHAPSFEDESAGDMVTSAGSSWSRQRVGMGLTIVGCLTIAAALFLPWFSFSWSASPRDPHVLADGVYSLWDILAHWSTPIPLLLPVACLFVPGALALIGISLALLRARAGTWRDLLTLELIVLLAGFYFVLLLGLSWLPLGLAFSQPFYAA
ncbi:MAG TPA: hypothetical protein VF807_06450, partial [Ktedonobacterales bacterium]